MMTRRDLVVIGAGPAGMAAATKAAEFEPQRRNPR